MSEKYFSFGKNWKNFVEKKLTPDRIEEARKSLLEYLPKEEYFSKTFLDIGCGSGIFSFNAARLGSRVISFDVDEFSVESTKLVKERFQNLLPKDCDWKIFQASILEPGIEDKTGKADIVYSWGVLHHTGNMNQAIKNAASLVKPQGWFIIAIYNRAPSSENWVKIKRFYNQTNWLVRQCMVLPLVFYTFFYCAASNVKRRIQGKSVQPVFSRERGMSIYYDMIDWIGGYPYEFGTWKEIKDFVDGLGFSLVKTPLKIEDVPNTFRARWSFTGTGNNIFVFKKL